MAAIKLQDIDLYINEVKERELKARKLFSVSEESLEYFKKINTLVNHEKMIAYFTTHEDPQNEKKEK